MGLVAPPQRTREALEATSYELRVTSYELRVTSLVANLSDVTNRNGGYDFISPSLSACPARNAAGGTKVPNGWGRR